MLVYHAAFAQNSCSTTVYSGHATYYTGGSASACSIDTAETGIYYCAINQAQYDTSAYCGACLSATGSNGTQILVVNDNCLTCQTGDLDLSPASFQAVVGNLSISTGNITWKLISCPFAAQPLWLTNALSNTFYASFLIHHAANEIATVDAFVNSNWQAMTRTNYNYWTLSLNNDTMMNVRVTDIYGQQVIINNVKTNNATSSFNATSNFAACQPSGIYNLNVAIPTIEAQLIHEQLRLKYADGFQTILLTDLSGRVVYSNTFNNVRMECAIGVENLTNGMYIIQLKKENAAPQTLKWVKN